MDLEQFNEMPEQEAAELVRACADVERWVAEVVAARPFASVADAVRAAQTVADPWSDDEIDAALARHPRIGERANGDDAEAAMSRTEQASVADAGTDVQVRLAAGNRAYEERFGHVFLVRAAGRTPGEILALLEQRLGNTPEEERANAARNLREIAALRLRGMVSS